MDLLNMFSDLAPISNNGYRQQLHTDPGILQGQDFLRNENKIINIVKRNLDLNLVSDINGSESRMINSVENFEPSEDKDNDYSNSNSNTNNNNIDDDDDNKNMNTYFKEGLDTNKLNDYASVAKSFATCQMGEVFSNQKGKCVKRDGFQSDIQEGFIEGLTTNEKYNNLKDQYNIALTAYNKIIQDNTIPANGGLASSITSSQANEQRTKFFKELKELSVQLNNISNALVNSVKTDTRNDFNSYNKMQTEIDNVQLRIKQIYNKIQENKLKNPADIQTALAKENETALLTKQRYYMYIIWFIIMVLILYVTITNLVDAESSFTVLLISLIVLLCLFLFFIYNRWNGEWYDFKYKLKNLNLTIPDIPKLDFNPLVRIRYTT